MSVISRVSIIFARKWIGGITISDAIKASRELNSSGKKVIINYLGEDFSDNPKVDRDVGVYSQILMEMHKHGIRGSIAVKPTQLGLCINYRVFFSNYERILKHAKKYGIFVWLDMEDYMTVGDTIKAYMKLFKKYKNAGICIQSKLRRSLKDVKAIVRGAGIIRLVKGAYKARPGIAYMSKSEVDSNYIECMDYLFNNSKKFMVATHDGRIIDEAKALERKHGTRAMFGMLKGIRPGLASSLASSGEDIYIYVPFGDEWLNYSIRRLKELEHSLLIARSILGV
ncbi:MAG: proline dehydrogenase family protein [Candidatus Micrarchaeaceae archaeon]